MPRCWPRRAPSTSSAATPSWRPSAPGGPSSSTKRRRRPAPGCCPPISSGWRTSGAGRSRVELDRRRVDAVAQPGRRRAVVEDVAEVAAALGAGDLGADHEKAAVLVLLDRGALRRLVEAGPAAVGVELGRRREQLGPAARAPVGALGVGVPVLAGERALGALLSEHVVLLRRQLLPPLGVRLLNSLLHATKLARPIRMCARPPSLVGEVAGAESHTFMK